MDRADGDRLRDFAITDSSGELRQDVLANPYGLYDRLRSQEPVHYDSALRGWMLTRYADVEAAMVDPRLSAARTLAYLSELPAVDRERFRRFAQTRGDMLLFCDPPKHSRLRRVVREAIRAGSSDGAAYVQSSLAQLLDEIGDRSTVDLMAEIALPLPIAVLLELLGVPAEDATRIRSYATTFNLAIGGVIRADLVAAAEQVVEELSDYLERLIAGADRGSAVLSYLRGSVQAGTLSHDELVASCLMLVTAGHESASNLIGNGLHALCCHPDQLAWLREDPSRVRIAIDELLRYDAPVQLTAREALSPLTIGGKRIAAGERVIPLWGAANRDPAMFSDPSVLDLGRAASRQHLSFGSGRHRCLGASLARVEAEVVIRSLIERYRTLRLAEPPEWKPNFSFRGPRRLVVAVETA